MAKKVFVTGNGTEVGKTVVSAILVEACDADYWKPIQSGDLDNSDSHTVAALLSDSSTHKIFPEAYKLSAPLSPHAAARIDGIKLTVKDISIPQTERTLIIEGAGGLLVPLNDAELMIDLIQASKASVVFVSRHYLGSINHTLLSLEALLRRNIPVQGLIFNGDSNPDTEHAIETHSGLPILGQIRDETTIDRAMIEKYAAIFRDQI